MGFFKEVSIMIITKLIRREVNMRGKIKLKIWQVKGLQVLTRLKKMPVCDIAIRRLKTDLRSLQLCFLR